MSFNQTIDNYDYIDQYNDLYPLDRKLSTKRSIKSLMKQAYQTQSKKKIERLRIRSLRKKQKEIIKNGYGKL